MEKTRNKDFIEPEVETFKVNAENVLTSSTDPNMDDPFNDSGWMSAGGN